MSTLLRTWLRVIGFVGQRQAAAGVHPQAGQVIVEWLALGALGIVVIVGLIAGVKAIGDDVLNLVRGQLGV